MATTIQITLYNLIEAISDEAKAGEDGLIVQSVLHLIETGKLKFVVVPSKSAITSSRYH